MTNQTHGGKTSFKEPIDYLHLLTPNKKEKGKHICPKCGGHNLSFSKDGAHTCYNYCGITKEELKKAMGIWIDLSDRDELLPMGSRQVQKQVKPKPKSKPVPLPAKIELAKFKGFVELAEVRDLGGGGTETIYQYSDTHRVERIDRPNEKKTTLPYYLKSENKWIKGKGDQPWNAYRLNEALEHGKDKFTLVVEGEKCVEAARGIGLAAITWQGASWDDESIRPTLEALKDRGVEGIIVYPDNDKTGTDKAKKIEEIANGISFPVLRLDHLKLWQNCPEKGDIADWIEAHPNMDKSEFIAKLEKEIHEALEARSREVEKLEEEYQETEDQPKIRKMGMIELLKFLPQTYQGLLRFNELTQAVELKGKEMLVEDAYVILAKYHNVKTSKGIASDAFLAVAKENTFHPVRDYLNAIESKPKADIDNLASKYLGSDNDLYNTFLKKTLIAAVARIYNPGCKVDTTLVLQGKQGLGKSTFFDVLGGDWFDDSMGSGSDKDDLLILHKCWLQEWGELERVFSKKQAGELKSFLSRREDTYRAPYARSTASRKRMSIIVGSVNNAQFLVDPTGDRRYWVIPIGTSKINTQKLREERDSIWAAAIAAYKENQQWWLSDEEQLLSNQNNNQFRDRDEWEMEIENYIRNKEQVAIKEILINCFDFETNGKMDRSSQYRVKNALVSLGWTNSANAVSHTWQPKSGYPNTERLRVWRSSDTSNTSTDTSSQGCAEECVSPTPDGAMVSTSDTSNTSISKDFENKDNEQSESMRNNPTAQKNKSLKIDVQGCADVSEASEALPEEQSSLTHQLTHQTHQRRDVSELEQSAINILANALAPKTFDSFLLLVQASPKWVNLTPQELKQALDNLVSAGKVEIVDGCYGLSKS